MEGPSNIQILKLLFQQQTTSLLIAILDKMTKNAHLPSCNLKVKTSLHENGGHWMPAFIIAIVGVFHTYNKKKMKTDKDWEACSVSQNWLLLMLY